LDEDYAGIIVCDYFSAYRQGYRIKMICVLSD